MLVIHDTHTRPSKITGLSLVLFLFLSLLSMMAAYEASKPADEPRNSVVASFHEYSAQVADPETSDPALLVEASRESLPTLTFHFQPVLIVSLVVMASKNFDARGPPLQRSAAS